MRGAVVTRPTLSGAALLAVAICVAACGGSSTPAAAPASSSSPTADVGALYLAAVAPANAAGDVFRAKINDQSTQAEVVAAAAPLADAYVAMDERLARIPFTGQAATDVRALVTADGQLIGDLRAIGQQTAFSLAAFQAQFGRDVAAVGSAVTLIRADLGLPAAS